MGGRPGDRDNRFPDQSGRDHEGRDSRFQGQGRGGYRGGRGGRWGDRDQGDNRSVQKGHVVSTLLIKISFSLSHKNFIIPYNVILLLEFFYDYLGFHVFPIHICFCLFISFNANNTRPICFILKLYICQV